MFMCVYVRLCACLIVYVSVCFPVCALVDKCVEVSVHFVLRKMALGSTMFSYVLVRHCSQSQIYIHILVLI